MRPQALLSGQTTALQQAPVRMAGTSSSRCGHVLSLRDPAQHTAMHQGAPQEAVPAPVYWKQLSKF